MSKISEQLLKIAIEKYKKTNNSEVELEYKEYSGIVGIEGNIEDVLDDLINVNHSFFGIDLVVFLKSFFQVCLQVA